MSLERVFQASDLLGPAIRPVAPPRPQPVKAPKLDVPWGSFHQGIGSSIAAVLTWTRVRTAAMLLPMPWWKEPQGTSSFGAFTGCGRGGATGLMAGPKRSDAWKTRSKDISLSIIARRACSVWAVNLMGLPTE